MDSKILSLARNFLLMLSLICFWPYTRFFKVGWKLLLKFIPCYWSKGRLGFEFQPCWGWNPELGLLLLAMNFASSWVNGQELPECPVSPHVSHVIRDSETWLTSWCGDSSFFMRRSILAWHCRFFWAMGEEAEVDGELWGQVSHFWGGTTRRLTIPPILSRFGLKLLGRSKPVMHCSASIKR